MENREPSGLPESEKTKFQEHYQQQRLPVDLEEKVVTALKERKFFQYLFFQRHTYLKPAVMLGLALLLFFSGVWFGLRNEKSPVANVGNPYLLLLFNPPGFVESASHAKEYDEWFHRLNDKAATGEELQDKGWHISLVNDKPAIANEFSDAGKPSGFFIIHAASEKEALAVAATCPHVKYKGVVSVFPIQKN